MQQYSVFIILIITLGLFIWGRWRYDVVACMALMATVVVGAVPYKQAFSGFSNPAVVTVAMVMIITQAITHSGVVDRVVAGLAPATGNVWLHVAILSLLAAVLSAFMNNVGALALVMPLAVQTAFKNGRSPSLVLMPIAFSSILGGMTTLIGTPPNILIANYRHDVLGVGFTMFDFAPVGVVLAVAGILFITVVGWRLIPKARTKHKIAEDLFQIADYITEALISEESSLIDQTVADLEELVKGGCQILGIIRDERKRLNLPPSSKLKENDILIIEASSADLEQLVKTCKLELVGNHKASAEALKSKDVELMEVVVIPGSQIEGRTIQKLRLRTRYQINLLAISRKGQPFRERLKNVRLQAGDVLLLQGNADTLADSVLEIGFLPLAERSLRLGLETNLFLPLLIFAFSLILVVTKVFPVQIAFSGAVLLMVLFNVIPIRRVYGSIDWSVIVLLGAMLPVGMALETTGGTELIANWIVSLAGNSHPIVILGIILIVTMCLSDVMNNAATAVVMAPISISIAETLGFSIDPFLMTVAVGASCAFLTPIGHQNNTLVMGPGGYHFGDYWRMGLPLELLIIAISLPLIPYVWSFN